MVKEKGLTLEGARRALKSKKRRRKTSRIIGTATKPQKELLSIEEEFDRLHKQQNIPNPTETEHEKIAVLFYLPSASRHFLKPFRKATPQQWCINCMPSPINRGLAGAEQTDRYFPLLQGKRIAVLSNQTGMVGNEHLVDLLKRNHFDCRHFSPEHGFVERPTQENR